MGGGEVPWTTPTLRGGSYKHNNQPAGHRNRKVTIYLFFLSLLKLSSSPSDTLLLLLLISFQIVVAIEATAVDQQVRWLRTGCPGREATKGREDRCAAR